MDANADAAGPDAGVDGGDDAGNCSPVASVSWNPPDYPGGSGTNPSEAVPVWNGAGYTVAWQADPQSTFEPKIFVNRLDTDGREVSGTRAQISPNGAPGRYDPRIAFSGTRYAVVYSAGTSPTQIWMRLLDSSLAPRGSEVLVWSGDLGDFWGARIAWNSDNSEWAVIWQRDNPVDGTDLVAFQRLSFDGQLIGTPIDVGPGSLGRSASDSFFWNGSNYVFATEGYARVTLTLVSGNGGTIKHSHFDRGGSAPGSSNPVVAQRPGGEFALVWTLSVGNGKSAGINFARADVNGDVIAGSRVDAGGGLGPVPGVVWTGTDWLVVWGSRYLDILGVIVSQRLDAAGNAIGDARELTCRSEFDFGPYLVWGGNQVGVSFLRKPLSSPNAIPEGRFLISP